MLESVICRIRWRNDRNVSAAIARMLNVRPSRNLQSGSLMFEVNGFWPNESAVTRQPRRDECFRRLNRAMRGRPCRPNCFSPKSSQRSTVSMAPAMNAHVASINVGSGVKSTVTSTRFSRGRTPTALLCRFVASKITGTGKMCASRYPSLVAFRSFDFRAVGNEKL
ncbi:MAG: hypothetical protein DMF48_05760 [Verrucomicrobia bacterium]|nr:MAG: hypothetical protein DMF48_05760 [Verrucomicrobiota bacterium]